MIISLLVGLVGGGGISYLIARHYYQKTAEDQEQMAQELKQTVRELKDYALGGLRPYAADLMSALERLEGKFIEGEGRIVIERAEDGTPRQIRLAPTQVIRAGKSISSEEGFEEATVLVGPPPTPSRRVVALEGTSHGQATVRGTLSAGSPPWWRRILTKLFGPG